MNFRSVTHRGLQWLADTLYIPPVLTGIVGSLALGGLALWIAWLTGIVAAVAAGTEPDIAVRAPVTLYMLIAYLPMALYYLDNWTHAALKTVAGNFALNDFSVDYPRLLANAFGVTGVFAMYTLFLHQPDDPLLVFMPPRWNIDFVFPLVGLVFMGWFLFRFMFLLVWNAVAVSQTARHITRIDLFDTASIRPYAQQGVRSSLLAVVALSISANLWLDPNSPTVATATSLVLLVLSSTLALVLPGWGIHLRLKTTKQEELARLRAAIAARRDPETRSVEDAQQLRADLAIERRLTEISEWPFDAGSYGRVALYVFLGLGSWVGAALVERLLESLGR